MRRTPTLTKQVRAIYEEHLLQNGYWPYAFIVCDQVGLSAEQVRDAVWAPAADEWRRGVIARFKETQTCRT